MPKKIDWSGAVTLSILTAREGGYGMYALNILRSVGIPAKRGSSPYIGHVGILVPRKFVKRAERLIL